MLTEFHIGIDDTDSKLGGCTTYTAALIFEELVKRNLGASDLPWLVRLNPNIPWKTRGNGALAIHLNTEDNQIDSIKELVLRTVEETSDPSIPSTDPAVVFLRGIIPSPLEYLTTKALHDVIRIEEAERTIRRMKGESHTFKGRRGIIGALAAIGYGRHRDYTYEIIAYRSSWNLGRPRQVDLDSVRRMDAGRPGQTFNSVDPETGRVLVCPHGPDPVLLGIRGEDPLTLLAAFHEIETGETIERVMLFKTNQGTDAHLSHRTDISQMGPCQSVVVVGTVETRPATLRGGHVIFKLSDETGRVDCAAYKPTGSLRDTVAQLVPGDAIRASGGVRSSPVNGLTLNLEKLEILRLTVEIKPAKPRCPICGSSCESMGRGQDFRCKKCGLRVPRSSAILSPTTRALTEKSYIPPPRANRHLTRPQSRPPNRHLDPAIKKKTKSSPTAQDDLFVLARLMKTEKLGTSFEPLQMA